MLERMKTHPMKVLVSLVNQAIYHDQRNEEALRKILAVDALAANLRKSFEKRLKKTENQ